MSRVLVTGAGGFVGRALVRALVARGDEVIALQRGEYPELAALGVTCVRGDLTRAEDVVRACEAVEVVYHVAARTGFAGKPEAFEAVNVGGTDHVIHACQAQGVGRLVYCSSPSVTLDGTDQRRVDESVPYASTFLAHYPRTKAIAEARVLAANGSALQGGGALRTVALRPHLIFGPGDEHLMPRLIARAKSGRLKIIGDGENEVDWTYVDNVALAHVCAAEALADVASPAAGRAYFITNGEPVNAWQFFNEILVALELPPLRRHVPLALARAVGRSMDWTWRTLGLSGEPPLTEFAAVQVATTHTYAIDNARRDLGYVPAVSLAEGVARTVPWLKEQLRAGHFG